MINKTLCKCGYCGTKWISEVQYTWMNVKACPHCGENKNIEMRKIEEYGMDVYGYRFSEKKPNSN